MITLDQLLHATVSKSATAEKFLNSINETLDKFQINTPARQLCFLAQIGHESGGLFYTEELASGQAYEGRKSLGNTQPNDGVRFKGRGLIQITGRANYQSLSDYFSVDFVSNPTQLGGKNSGNSTAEQMKWSTLSAGWFWNLKKLNDMADKITLDHLLANQPDGTHDANLENFISITKKINGGTNGLQDRVTRYNAGFPFFKS